MTRVPSLIHAAATPANVADSTVLPELLHGQETRVWVTELDPENETGG